MLKIIAGIAIVAAVAAAVVATTASSGSTEASLRSDATTQGEAIDRRGSRGGGSRKSRGGTAPGPGPVGPTSTTTVPPQTQPQTQPRAQAVEATIDSGSAPKALGAEESAQDGAGDARGNAEATVPPPPSARAPPPSSAQASAPAPPRARPPSPSPTPASTSSPAELLHCPSGEPVVTTPSLTRTQYASIAAGVRDMLDALGSIESCQGMPGCARADFAGCVLRLAGHDLMDFDPAADAGRRGGSDGCVDFGDADNAGLVSTGPGSGETGLCVVESPSRGPGARASLQRAYEPYCETVSVADFLVIAAEAVVSASAAEPVPFADAFRFGRTTARTCAFARGRMPDAEGSCSAVRGNFVTRLGLDWAESAALMGAHTVGRAQIQNSGYDGWWADPGSQARFDSGFFRSLLTVGWTPQRAVGGNPGKNQWRRGDPGPAPAPIMMLNTDLCLAYDFQGRDLVAGGPDATECCAWIAPPAVANRGFRAESAAFDTLCGVSVGGGANGPRGARGQRVTRGTCCRTGSPAARRTDCGSPRAPGGPAFEAVRNYADKDSEWLRDYQAVWKKVTENGYDTTAGELRPLL